MRARPTPAEVRLRPGDPRWPAGLDDLPDPPVTLRAAPAPPELGRAVAIVGTRRSDPEAEAFARRLASDLARAGCVVVSGGASGIDAAAHRGALDGGGRTVAVLATGLSRPYPRAHRALFGEIARAGALVTEQEDEAPAARWAFLRRNRLIAAMARAVVVVQAPARSGALSTARWATRLDRPRLATPAAPWDARGRGCLGLLEAGWGICTSARDVLSVPALAVDPSRHDFPADAEIKKDFNEIDADGRAVLACLGARPRHVDEIAGRTGLAAERVHTILVRLLLQGSVVERGIGRYASIVEGS